MEGANSHTRAKSPHISSAMSDATKSASFQNRSLRASSSAIVFIVTPTNSSVPSLIKNLGSANIRERKPWMVRRDRNIGTFSNLKKRASSSGRMRPARIPSRRSEGSSDSARFSLSKSSKSFNKCACSSSSSPSPSPPPPPPPPLPPDPPPPPTPRRFPSSIVSRSRSKQYRKKAKTTAEDVGRNTHESSAARTQRTSYKFTRRDAILRF
mmetsp:Transcript_46149/g.75304  ORF Transcript_46149/g.75304 Transcript_46149/m.75304 type:complete len:210 (+) Transcript_46149:1039-1668(+)